VQQAPPRPRVGISGVSDGSILAAKGIKVDSIKTVGVVATEIGKEQSTENVREILHDWGMIIMREFSFKEITVEDMDTPVTIREG
jgi:hypothetical protein